MFEIIVVLLILAGAVVLFSTEKLPVDMVALLILAALLVTGLVTPEEGVSGFSSSATLTVGAMFVLSAGLEKTGAVTAIGRLLVRTGKTPTILLFVVMMVTGIVSAFINNTAAVAVFLPLVLTAGAARKVSSSRLLIPLSYASQMGGVCTLIGTSTNLLVNSIAQRAGVGEFSMFEFSKLGIIMFVAGTLFMLLIGKHLLPERRGGDLTEEYQLGEYITELRVMPDSPLIGKTLIEAQLSEQQEINVLELLRGSRKIWSPLREPLAAEDILLVRGPVQSLMELRSRVGFEIEPEFKLRDASLQDEDVNLVEALVAPNSRWVGQTLASLDFRRRFNAIVLGIHRSDTFVREKLAAIRLRFGDAFLLLIHRDDLTALRKDENVLVLNEVETPAPYQRKAPLALAIMAAVVVLAALKVLPILVAAIAGCAIMILLRCIRIEDAYGALDMKVLLLLAGVLPLGIAMENTGAAQLIADQALRIAGGLGPVGVLAVIYFVTAALTECMSNTAAAVLLAPIAISTAQKLGVDPTPFLVAVTFAASTSFATPVGYQTNTMVYGAGGYRFTDFTRVGVPLNLLFWGLAVWFIPIFWPF